MAIENLKYKGLTFTLPEKKQVTEEEINAEVERFRQQFAEEVVNDENATVQNGDTTDMDFCGYVNGEKFEGGEATHYELKIGSHSFIDGFEDQMIGMKVGEEKDINVTFPTNYVPHLAGKPAVFKVKVHQIKRKTDGPLTDETVKAHTKMQSLEEFKACYRIYLNDKYEQEFMGKKQEAMLSAVSKDAKVDVDEAKVQEEVELNFKALEQQLKQYGLTMDQFFEMNQTDMENERKRVYGMVYENMKRIAIVEEIKKAENVTVTEEELNDYLKSVDTCGDEHCNHEHDIDKDQVKQSMSYAKVLQFLEDNNSWTK